jgi:DNA-binding MarR family transcriptional regulator
MSPDKQLEDLLTVLIERFGGARTLSEVYATTYGMRAYREGRTISLKDIAEKTGVSKQNLSRWLQTHVETDHVVTNPAEDDARIQELTIADEAYAYRHLEPIAKVFRCEVDPPRGSRFSH